MKDSEKKLRLSKLVGSKIEEMDFDYLKCINFREIQNRKFEKDLFSSIYRFWVNSSCEFDNLKHFREDFFKSISEFDM